MKAGSEAKIIADIPNRNWSKFAESFGAEGIRIENPADICREFEQALNHSREHKGTPILVDIVCDAEPKAPNQSLE